jgi:hypothetical protein
MITFRSVLLRMRNVSDESCRMEVVEKIETHFKFNCFFFCQTLAVYDIMWKNVVQPDRPLTTIQYGACVLQDR